MYTRERILLVVMHIRTKSRPIENSTYSYPIKGGGEITSYTHQGIRTASYSVMQKVDTWPYASWLCMPLRAIRHLMSS